MKSYRNVAALATLALALPVTTLGATAYPKTIALPAGFSPEGIATHDHRFYVGSRANGAIYGGDLLTGEGSLLVAGAPGRVAGGLKVDKHNRLFVAGGPTGKAFVYDGETGAQIAVYQLTSPPGFVNDVVITRTGAWFTDSFFPVLYHVPIAPGGELGPAGTLPLTSAEPGVIPVPTRSNGIDATPDGKTLIFLAAGRLLTADAATGATDQIELASGPMTFSDGLLLDGKTLYVVRSLPNLVMVIQLAPDFSSGTVVATLTDPDFDEPTTVAEHGDRLYFPNARLTTLPTPATPYWVTQVRKPSGQ